MQPTSCDCANGVDWSLGSVSGRAGLHKGVFQNRDRPSQMKHAELKNCRLLFRVSFSPFRFDQAGDQNLQSQPRRSGVSVPGTLGGWWS